MIRRSITVRDAVKDDSEAIARGIVMAIGEDLALGIGNGKGIVEVVDAFRILAEMEDSQYSYRNALIAETPEGKTAGIVVAYDGDILLRARRLFFVLAKEKFGWDIYDLVPDGEPEVETDPSEYYLDSLAVWPEFRGCGVASRLIEGVIQKGREAGKPVGLLCAEHNDKAYSLYCHLGFEEIGERPFAGEMMRHMVKE